MSIIRSRSLPHERNGNGNGNRNGESSRGSASQSAKARNGHHRSHNRNGLESLWSNGLAIDGQKVPALDEFHRSALPQGCERFSTTSESHGANRSANGNGHVSRHLDIVILGLSITSSWGNGHATTYRGLMRELCARGHRVLFLERDQPWYAGNRDLPDPPYGRTVLYSSIKQLKDRFASSIRNADLVIVGSGVQEGAQLGNWVTSIAHGVTAFYDFDLLQTVVRLRKGEYDCLSADLIERYQMYLSTTGGHLLDFIEKHYGSPMARPLYCSVDPEFYFPEDRQIKWDIGYTGIYSEECQPALDELMLEAARRCPDCRFVVAGPQYPREIFWPRNVKRIAHLPLAKRRAFYNSQKFTLNVTCADVAAVGYSPGVQLFEAAACGVPIITEFWEGLDDFFEPGAEILVSRSCEETLSYLRGIDEQQRQRIGRGARQRVLRQHIARHRAIELEDYGFELLKRPALKEAALA